MGHVHLPGLALAHGGEQAVPVGVVAEHEAALVAAAPPGTATDLAEPLGTLAERFAALRAVVLASDGDWNKGRPPLDAAQTLRLAQVPVFAVPAGSPTKLPDLDLTSLDCPTMGVAGKPVRVVYCGSLYLAGHVLHQNGTPPS